MFHLCNIHYPSLIHKAETLDYLFNPMHVSWPMPEQAINSISFVQWFDWLQHTVTDDNWLDILATRVMRRQYCMSLDEAREHMEYQLTKEVLKDSPKWLVEVITVNFSSAKFCIESFTPRTYPGFETARGMSREYNYSRNPLSRFDSNVRTSVDLDLAAIIDTYNTHAASGEFAEVKISVSDFGAYHGFLVRGFLQYACNQKVILHKGVGGVNRASLTPQQARTVIESYLAATDTFSKHRFYVEYNAEAFYIILQEPKRTATREQLSTVLNYSTDVLEYLPYNIRSKTEAKTPLYGIELETATNYHPREVIAAQQELFFLCKSDGSISGKGDHRYEMVTVPATFKAHRRLWADWFSKLDYEKFDTSKDTGNGMHIHVDRSAFSSAHLNKFTWFFINPANFDFLYEISERPSKNDFHRWAPPPYVSTSSKVAAIRTASTINRGNRGIVHYKKNKTVEVRMFKGVVSYATIIKNLEFVDAVFHFTLEVPTVHNTLKAFLSWLESKPSNQYKLLREFISQLKNIEQLTLSNTLKDYLFGVAAPEKVLDKLKKAPFEVTNKHLTILNRERRKRTYVLNKDGTLSLAYTTGGKLASLDREMQAKITRGTSSFTLSNM